MATSTTDINEIEPLLAYRHGGSTSTAMTEMEGEQAQPLKLFGSLLIDSIPGLSFLIF